MDNDGWWAHQDLNLEPSVCKTTTENEWLQRVPSSRSEQFQALLGMVGIKLGIKFFGP